VPSYTSVDHGAACSVLGAQSIPAGTDNSRESAGLFTALKRDLTRFPGLAADVRPLTAGYLMFRRCSADEPRGRNLLRVTFSDGGE
jgi:hypothetical protein